MNSLHLIFNTSLPSFIIKEIKWWLVHVQIPGSLAWFGSSRDSWVTLVLQLKHNLKRSDCALGCTGLIKQNSWWWAARCLKTLVLSSSSHLGHGRASRLTGSRSRQGAGSTHGEGRGGGSHRWFVAVFAGCSVSSTISWFSRAEPAARVAELRSNTVALPLLYFTFLLSARI